MDLSKDYGMYPNTYLDFLIFSRISKRPLLAIEVDGYNYHKEGSRQGERDAIKNSILVNMDAFTSSEDQWMR